MFLVLMFCSLMSLILDPAVPVIDEVTFARISLSFTIAALGCWILACAHFMRTYLWRCPRCRQRFFVGPHTHSRMFRMFSPWRRIRLWTRVQLVWRYSFRQFRCEHCRVRIPPVAADLAT